MIYDALLVNRKVALDLKMLVKAQEAQVLFVDDGKFSATIRELEAVLEG